MSKECHLCGKRKTNGGHITRRGLAKKAGGIGTHVVKNTRRWFKPNLQAARIRVGKRTKKVLVCTSCIRSGKVNKA
jgi:large subunit ribosomal protein L28